MRDLAMVVLLPFLIYFSFKRAYIAAGLWLWTSAFKINQLIYGFASAITYNKFFALITIVSFISDKNKPKFKMDGLSGLVILFFIWTTLSTIFSNVHPATVWATWEMLMKIILFYFFSIAILHTKKHIEFFIWILIFSIGILSAKEGVKFIVSGGSHRFTGIYGISGDNNIFGVMILIVLALGLYLLTQITNKKLKNAVSVGLMFMVLGLIATYSRAGFIGLAILTLMAFKDSKKKIIWILLIGCILFSAKSFMPEQWFNRMNTVEHAEDDGSFMHRVMVWKMCTVIAMKNPLLGEGFRANENLSIWQKYHEYYSFLDFIETPEADYNESVRAAHSMYFQVLAEHGFVGLFLFLLILISAYLKLGIIKSRAKHNNMDDWVIQLVKKIRLAILMYCITGGTVAVAYLDLFYSVLVIIYTLDHHIVAEKKQSKINYR